MRSRTARLAGLLSVLLVPCSLLLGRPLERRYPEVVSCFPELAAVGLVILTALSARALTLNRRRLRFPPSAVRVPLAGILILAILIPRYLIVLPVEYVHAAKYSVLALLVHDFEHSATPRRRMLSAFFAVAALGALEETLQSFVPDRIFDVKDLLLNVSAALLGASAAHLLLMIRSFEEERGR